MPLEIKDDSLGRFIRWGKSGKKYYFDKHDVQSYLTAREDALRQMRAIKASQNVKFSK